MDAENDNDDDDHNDDLGVQDIVEGGVDNDDDDDDDDDDVFDEAFQFWQQSFSKRQLESVVDAFIMMRRFKVVQFSFGICRSVPRHLSVWNIDYN